MRSMKKAFTLTELLVALGIAGVIAAIIVPQLIKNIQKQTSGPALGRAVYQTELGCQNLIQEENAKVTNGAYYTKLSDIPDISVEKLAPYLGLVATSKINDGFFKEIDKRNSKYFKEYN